MKIINMHKANNKKGFTMLEILIAMVVLSIGLLGMAALIGGIIKSNKLSNRMSAATVLAQDKMEEIRQTGYYGMPETETTTTEDYNSITGYPLYKRVTLTEVANPGTGMKRITVTVFWDLDDHSVSLNMILAG